MSTLIELKDVCKAYDGQNVVDNVNLNIEKGEFVTFLGPSGSEYFGFIVTKRGSISFFWQLGTNQIFSCSKLSFTIKSFSVKTTCSSSSSLKKVCASVPSADKISIKVDIEGLVKSFSSCEIYPFVSSHLSASSDCVK